MFRIGLEIHYYIDKKTLNADFSKLAFCMHINLFMYETLRTFVAYLVKKPNRGEWYDEWMNEWMVIIMK